MLFFASNEKLQRAQISREFYCSKVTIITITDQSLFEYQASTFSLRVTAPVESLN